MSRIIKPGEMQKVLSREKLARLTQENRMQITALVTALQQDIPQLFAMAQRMHVAFKVLTEKVGMSVEELDEAIDVILKAEGDSNEQASNNDDVEQSSSESGTDK